MRNSYQSPSVGQFRFLVSKDNSPASSFFSSKWKLKTRSNTRIAIEGTSSCGRAWIEHRSDQMRAHETEAFENVVVKHEPKVAWDGESWILRSEVRVEIGDVRPLSRQHLTIYWRLVSWTTMTCCSREKTTRRRRRRTDRTTTSIRSLPNYF